MSWNCEACGGEPASLQSYAGSGPVVICNECGRDWNEHLRTNYRSLFSQFVLFGASFAKLRNGMPSETGMTDDPYDVLGGYMDTENELLIVWRKWSRERPKRGGAV